MRTDQLLLRVGAIRLLSVTAAVATACALWAGPASAATANAGKYNSRTTVSVRPKTAYAGTEVELLATVHSWHGTPTGKVTFTWNGVRLCVGHLRHGSAHCYTRFYRARKYWVRGTYSGNASHYGSSGIARVKVVLAPTSTTITSINPDRDPAGDPAAVAVKVASVAGTPTGSVVVKSTTPGDTAPGYTCTIKALAHGTGSCDIVPPVPTYGDISLEATYSGDATHLPSGTTGAYTLVVPDVTKTTLAVSPAAGTVGTKETLTATVVNQAADDISPAAGGTGTVTFYVGFGGVVQPAGLLDVCTSVTLTYAGTGDNVATCSWTPTSPGPYIVYAGYVGDEHNLESNSAGTPLTVSS
jgi:hypothetical protein